MKREYFEIKDIGTNDDPMISISTNIKYFEFILNDMINSFDDLCEILYDMVCVDNYYILKYKLNKLKERVEFISNKNKYDDIKYMIKLEYENYPENAKIKCSVRVLGSKEITPEENVSEIRKVLQTESNEYMEYLRLKAKFENDES